MAKPCLSAIVCLIIVCSVFGEQTRKENPLLLSSKLEIAAPAKDHQDEDLAKRVVASLADFSCQGKEGIQSMTNSLFGTIHHLCEKTVITIHGESVELLRSSVVVCGEEEDLDESSKLCSPKRSGRKGRQLWSGLPRNSLGGSFLAYYVPDPIPITCQTCCKPIDNRIPGGPHPTRQPSSGGDSFWIVTFPNPPKPKPTNPWYPAPATTTTRRPWYPAPTTSSRPWASWKPTTTRPWAKPTEDHTWIVTTQRTTTPGTEVSPDEVEIIEAYRKGPEEDASKVDP